MGLIYADNAATTKMSRAAMAVLDECDREFWANPSSSHSLGRRAAEKLDAARAVFAELLNCRPDEIYFTSGGTEADNQAIATAAELGKKQSKKHIITSKFEHHAVLETLEALRARGFEITCISPGADGVIRTEDVQSAIRPDTCLVSVMTVNNELGTVQPIGEIGAVCREKGLLFHTDAVAAAGYIRLDTAGMNVDMLSMSAHKFHGPKGVGILYVRSGLKPEKIILGAGQERGARAGTENLPSIAAAAEAYREVCANMRENTAKLTEMRAILADGLLKLDGAHLNGSFDKRVPGNLNISIDGIDGETLALLLDERGICVSTGSACNSGIPEASYVLKAIGQMHGGIRITLSGQNTKNEIRQIVTAVTDICGIVRSLAGQKEGDPNV